MSEPPGRPALDSFDSNNPCARTALRRVGEYVLVAQLGDDALGSVYRALHADGRFVRLRVLQSPELSPHAVLAAAERQAERRAVRQPAAVASHGELHVADGTPYLIWPEANGWTLDFVLSRARAGGWGMPIEFALLIAERSAAQMEQAAASAPVEPWFHGALWPGFVSISSDAEVHVGGFGLAEAVLPALAKPRMWRDVAPYVAPETRATGHVHELSDVYSIGVLLIELLTGRRASADSPPQRWRADDDFSQEVSLFLRFALAQPSERFSSMARLHVSLKELIASYPFETSPADLALFLYDRLNPESRLLPGSFDGNSTNPVPADGLQPTPDRSPSEFEPQVPALSASRAVPAEPSPEEEPWPLEAVFGVSPPTRSVPLMRWITRVAALAAAIAGLVFVNLPIRPAAPPTETFSPGSLVRAAQTASPITGSVAPAIQMTSVLPSRRSSRDPFSLAPSRDPAPRAPVAAAPPPEPRDRAAAETLRLKAALARIESERLDAPVHAADTFQRARSQEQDGERLLGREEYTAARDAYALALDLFAESEALSRQERMRQIQISGEASGR